MKKYFRVLFLWALTCALFVPSLTSAGDHAIVKISTDDQHEKIVVRLANLQQTTAEIDIQALDDGKVWFYEYVTKQDGYAVQYNLRGLPDGDYLVFVRIHDKTWSRAFERNNQSVTFFDPALGSPPSARDVSSYQAREGRFFSKLRVVNNNVLEIRLANMREEHTRLNVVMMGHDLTFHRLLKGLNGYATALSFEDMQNGQYTVYLNGYEARVVQYFDITDDGLVLGRVDRMDGDTPADRPGRPEGDILASH